MRPTSDIGRQRQAAVAIAMLEDGVYPSRPMAVPEIADDFTAIALSADREIAMVYLTFFGAIGVAEIGGGSRCWRQTIFELKAPLPRLRVCDPGRGDRILWLARGPRRSN